MRAGLSACSDVLTENADGRRGSFSGIRQSRRMLFASGLPCQLLMRGFCQTVGIMKNQENTDTEFSKGGSSAFALLGLCGRGRPMRTTILASLTVVIGSMLMGCPGFNVPDDSAGPGGINPNEPAGETVPEIGEPVSLAVISESGVDAGVLVRFFVNQVEVRRTVLAVPAGQRMDTIGPDVATSVAVNGAYVSGAPTPSASYVVGREFTSGDLIEYVIPDPADECPNDPNKMSRGQCGCGVPDTDTDGDGVADCIDGCPNDRAKTEPGICDCGVSDVDTDGDGVADCIDGCPNDRAKTEPGICDCGVSDMDTDGDEVADCIDGCPDDPNKTAPGVCGCNVSDVDSDGDDVPNCIDGCPNDPLKTSAGECGCGRPEIPGCGLPSDLCPDDPNKTEPGICGCGVPDDDTDGDDVPDCIDGCRKDPKKTAPGVCGCGIPDTDVDSDDVTDCNDECPNSIPDLEVDEVGCPARPVKVDYDRDGDVDLDDFALFQLCQTGQDSPQLDPECGKMLLDGDDDVDGVDLALFFRCFNGANVPADPACRDCDGNGIDDRDDLVNCDDAPACGDCNGNGFLDSCDIASGRSYDEDENGTPDECEFSTVACCLLHGICEDVLEVECGSLGGTSQGDGSSCQATQCEFLCSDPCDDPACPGWNECDCVYDGDACAPACGGDPSCDPTCGGDRCAPGCPDACIVQICDGMDCNGNGVADSCEFETGVVYVDATRSQANQDGATWETAYGSLREALAFAQCAKPLVNQVWVARGIYRPDEDGERTATFNLLDGVAIYGGFAGAGSGVYPGGETELGQRNLMLNRTFLSGELGQPGVSSDDCYHVVTAQSVTETAVLDGFIISRGQADGIEEDGLGGGMLVLGGGPTIRNCLFALNGATYGAGLYVGGGSPALVNCIFVGNTAHGDYSSGGAVYSYYGRPTLTNCTIAGNFASNAAGGVHFASSLGGAMANCILWGNTAATEQTEAMQILVEQGAVPISYSNIQGWTGELGGEGNIGNNLEDHAPRFARDPAPGNGDLGDLRLQAQSPCLDAGSNLVDTNAVVAGVQSLPPTDFGSRPRLVDDPYPDTGAGEPPLVDVGAFERQEDED